MTISFSSTNLEPRQVHAESDGYGNVILTFVLCGREDRYLVWKQHHLLEIYEAIGKELQYRRNKDVL